MFIVTRRNGGDVPINQERSVIYIDFMEDKPSVARQSGTRAETLY
jgi:hypothetical protein